MGEWVHDAEIFEFWRGDSYGLSTIPKDCPDRAAAKELCVLMSRISEDHYCAGWLMGLEFSLFSLLYENTAFGFGEVDSNDRLGLFELSTRCGGWWRYEDDKGQQFVPMLEWTEMYKEGHQRF